jgi:2-oxoglutarate dehydrogenase complex dehydrogenase (E1) component-like enzyme
MLQCLHCHTCDLQVFYELHAERERQGKQAELAIVRLEQLAPFPFDLVCRELYRYPNAEPIWCQEEPMNMGAYFHVQVCVRFCVLTGRPVRHAASLVAVMNGCSASSFIAALGVSEDCLQPF